MSDKNPNLITHNIRCPCCGITVRRHIPEWEQALMRGERPAPKKRRVLLGFDPLEGLQKLVDAETYEKVDANSVEGMEWVL